MSTNGEKRVLEMAIAGLEKSTNIQVKTFGRSKASDMNNVQITIDFPNGIQLKRQTPKVRTNVTYSAIAETATEAADNGVVLVADYISQPQADKLRELNLPFFDTAGNAFFNAKGFFVFVSGRKGKIVKEKAPRLFRPPGMKILFALLTDPGLEQVSYRQISAETNVPTPTVGVFMNDLEKAGYLSKRISGERRLERRSDLFKRFVENYAESFRPTLEPVRFRAERFEDRWWERIDLSEFNAFWGGEAGGALLTKHLKPESATIYADSLLPKFQAKYRLVRDKNGNIEILKKFWTTGEIGSVAPPLIVYSELVATAERRRLETAQLIYDEHLVDIAEAAS